MIETTYRGRRAVQTQNDDVRVTILIEGGHIAEILHKPTGVNPLWTPPWTSIEPSTYSPSVHPGYGSDAESKLLAGLMGHNLCLDLFGPPSAEEAEAGLTVHGEASIAPYLVETAGNDLVCSTVLPHAQLKFTRRIRLMTHEVEISETVENLSALDRPIAWTQHVTLGPPFLECGSTEFRASAGRSKTYDQEFGNVFPAAVEFDWPMAPTQNGGTYDLQRYTNASSSSGYTTHLMGTSGRAAFFLAWSPSLKVAFGYEWNSGDFPWLGIWEENRYRQTPPWNGRTITRGMEFGVSPIPGPRREMIERGELFGVPGYRWIPAKRTLEAKYKAAIWAADECPRTL